MKAQIKNFWLHVSRFKLNKTQFRSNSTNKQKRSKLLLLEFEQNQMDRPHRSWKRDPRARCKRFASSNERVLKLSILNYFWDFSLAGFVKDSFGWYPPAFYMSGAFLALSGSSCSSSRSVCKTRSSRSWKSCHKLPPTPKVFVVSYPDPPRPSGCKVRLFSYS